MTVDSEHDGLLEALVDAERATMKPPEGAREETWERVVGTVALGAPPPLEPTSVATPTAAAPWLKIMLGVLLGGAVAAIGYRITAEPDPEPIAATTPLESNAAPDVDPTAPTSAPAVTALPPTPTATPNEGPAVVQQSAAKRARPATPKAADPPTTETPTSDLAEETRLLARARARLRAGSPKGALPSLIEHAERFPNGQLTEDRMVLRAQSLCESGDLKAGRKAAAALRKAFPASSHLPRVERTCG